MWLPICNWRHRHGSRRYFCERYRQTQAALFRRLPHFADVLASYRASGTLRRCTRGDRRARRSRDKPPWHPAKAGPDSLRNGICRSRGSGPIGVRLPCPRTSRLRRHHQSSAGAPVVPELVAPASLRILLADWLKATEMWRSVPSPRGKHRPGRQVLRKFGPRYPGHFLAPGGEDDQWLQLVGIFVGTSVLHVELTI
jgi:hypothetical protein